jgi:hypothetical protein
VTDPLDELFQVMPQDFVARRDELAKQLRKEGDRPAAAEVKKLRRPTASVWALNQLAHRHPDEVAELLAAGADLPAAQDALLAGDQERFRSALAQHRQLVSQLTALAVAMVEEHDVSATDQRQDISADLQAASTIPEAAEPFRQGRLPDRPSTLGEPVTGLPGGGSVVAPSTGRSTRSGGTRPSLSLVPDRDDEEPPPPPEDPKEAAARRRTLARADARVSAAEQALVSARDEQQQASQEVEDLEAELARARERLDAASERLEAMEDELADARAARNALD